MSPSTLGREILQLVGDLRARPSAVDIIAEPLRTRKWARIGVQGSDVLLLLPPCTDAPPKNVELAKVSVRFNVPCVVEQDGKRRDENLVIARMVAPPPQILAAFVDIIALMLSRLRTYEPASVRATIQTLAELFESLDEPATKTLHGLFGELVVMDGAPDLEVAAAAWHLTPYDRYDFSQDDVRVEVKTACGPRQHIFGYEQLRPVRRLRVVVASVLLEANSGGMTVHELVDRICSRIRSPELANWVTRQAVRALGASWPAAGRTRFALVGGKRAIRFYRANDVPCIKAPPFGVSMIQFRVDLQLVPAGSHATLRRLSPLTKAIIPPA